MALSASAPLLTGLALVSRAVDNLYVGGHIADMRNGIERCDTLTRTAAEGNYKNTFNNADLANTRCENTSISKINSDGLTFYNIETVAHFGDNQDPEYSQRTLRLQF